ncbi:Beta-ketoacyl synthase protein [Ancylostoma duodenale]|uniref:oleoyl-[acyl-carrier-protein] hydrolase n=1 Tax=Ancylostoma duodenale TaxID=51022 RepID=A0A0C2H5A9_9BILA|nr:Beta-ketoacyl synthase protein [Ancylostoma duodenale]
MANIFVVSSSVTDSETLARFFSRLPFKITGVIHNAGVLRDTIVERQSTETFKEVFSPKGDGFHAIEKLLNHYGHKLKHSIVMSSFTAVCGNAGQLNYGVSNAYLDHQIYLRRMEGRPGTTIHWGNWLEAGMATGVRQNLRNYGFLGLTTKEALAFLAYAIKYRPVELVAAKVNWPKLLRKRQDIRADIVVPLCHSSNSSVPEIPKKITVPGGKARKNARYIGAPPPKNFEKSDGHHQRHSRRRNQPTSPNNETQYAIVNVHKQNQDVKGKIAEIPVIPLRKPSISASACDLFALNVFFNDEADFHTSIAQNIDYLMNINCDPLPIVHEKSQALHVTGTSFEEIVSKLKQLAYQENVRDLTSKNVMIFSGQGAQYPCMGMQLRRIFPVFKHHFERCLTMADGFLKGDPSLLAIAEKSTQAHLLQQTKYGQPIMFAYGFACAMLWRHLGFQPDFYLGHSVGELVAGVVTGIMSLEDGVRLVVERSLALEKIADRGALLAVDSRAVAEILAKFDVSIAAVNSTKQIVLAGKQDELMAILNFTRSKDMQGTFVTVKYPFHSSFIEEEDLEDFRIALRGIKFRKAQTPIVSNVSGSLITTFSTEYLIKHVMSAVNTVECIRTLQHLNVKTWVEAGPSNTVVSFVRDTLERREAKEHVFLQTASERGQDVECVVDAALELEKRGVPIKWTSMYQNDVDSDPVCETLAFPLKFKGSFSENDHQVLQNHHVSNENLIPGAYQFYILLNWMNSKTEPGTYFTLDNTRFINPWKYEAGNEYELIQTHETTSMWLLKGMSLKRSETRTYSILEYKKPNAIWTLMDATMHAVCLSVVERRPDVYFMPIHVGEIYLRHDVDPSSAQSIVALTELLQENEKFIEAHGCMYIDDTLVFQYKNKVSLVLNAPLAEQPGSPTKAMSHRKTTSTNGYEPTTEDGQTSKQTTPIYILSSDGSFCYSAYDESEFWQQLKTGVIEEASYVRDFTSSNNAVMDIDIAGWDPEFFGVTPKEAQYIDVLQRLMMQSVSKCLENAKLARIPRNTGIFIGVSGSDFTNRVYNEIREQANGYYSSGTNGSCVAGRIAHWLKLEGPALVVDTACSSSFTALISAMDALVSRSCDYAIVGGINIILHDTVTEVLRNAGMLSAKRVCQVFDAGADGYIRSEVVGCVLLSRYGTNAIFEIPRWAIGHNGEAAALQVPNGSSQERIMKHVCGEKVRDVECHGTGTSLGDPIEIQAVSKVHGSVTVSSVKSHIGHAEAASGIASLISCLLQMENNYRSNQKHFKCPNPRIDFRAIQVNTTGEERELKNFAINNFGFSGTNCSITVKKLPHRQVLSAETCRFHLAPISANDTQTLQKIIDNFKEFVSWSDQEIGDICTILQKGRSAYRYRHCILYDNKRRVVWEYGRSPEVPASEHFLEQTEFVSFEYGRGFCLQHLHQNENLKNFLVNIIANLNTFEVPNVTSAVQFHQFIGCKFVEGHFVKWPLYNLAPLNYTTNVPFYPFRRERLWPFDKQFARNFGTSSKPREDIYYEKSLTMTPKCTRNTMIPVLNLGRMLGLKNITYYSISALQSSKLFNQEVIVLYHPYSSTVNEALELITLWQQLEGRQNFVLLIARPSNGTAHSEWTALIRTLASEHQLPYKFVSYSKLRDLESELSNEDFFECIFYKGPRRYVERLIQAKPNRIITSHAEHLLITGGTGGIGRKIIELTKPRKTTIVTRSGYSSVDMTKVPTEVSFVKSDLRTLKLPSDEHYDFVVHCAGFVDNALMGAMNTMRFRDVCLPKNVGLQTLYEALQGKKPTRLFIASSAASLLGSAGQANYAFANGIMTSIAEKFDVPTQIVHWGPLRDTGMLHGSHSQKIYEQLKTSGWNLLDPAHALNVLSTDAKNVLVFDGDFQQIVKSQPHLRKFLSKITHSDENSHASSDVSIHLPANTVTLPQTESEQPSLERIIADVSGIEDIEKQRSTPLMNLGIDSLMIEQIRSNINKHFRCHITSREIYENCSFDRLSKLVLSTTKSKPQEIVNTSPSKETANQHTDIAIIAYSGAFSGCADVDEFWNNLLAGKDCISRNKSEDDLVDAAGVIIDIDKFDYKFWNLTREDASVLDPQLRIFLQTTYQALEKSGYVQQRNSLRIGVFAGAEPSEYGDPNAEAEGSLRRLFAMNMKDFVSTFTAHMLNLRGPAVGVYSACSTALLAITQACNALRLSDVDLAIAGGISLVLPNQTRYVFQEGLVLSKSGTCRPFDENADGTVRGSAVGCVVLKRLDQALKDNDHIEAVIRGYGLSNDGLHKASFMAPNCQGQYECMREALSSVSADDVGRIAYVECHGTGTRVGDEIEIDALKKAYKSGQRLTIGSVKANIGHGFAGSGMAGLFKTIRILQEQRIPPQINISKPRTDTGFKVNTEIATLPAYSMAAVSSFGIGGTNVHLILDKPPSISRKHKQRSTIHILPLSGPTAHACIAQCRAIANYLKGKSDGDLGKVAATLQCRREHFTYRVAVAVSSIPEAVSQLEAVSSPVSASDIDTSNICFFFAPQGVQYSNMEKVSLNCADVFSEELLRLTAVATELFNVDFMDIMYPSDSKSDQISDAKYAQVALFIICRAVLAQLERWGISSDLLLGHSVGEYTAACYADMIDEYSCMNLLKKRGELVSQTAEARMLAVPGANVNFPDNVEVSALLSESLNCVVGSPDDIEALAKRLRAEQVSFRELATKHGFHSSMMNRIKDRFLEILETVRFRNGKRTIVSNIDGNKITNLSREYCWNHMRSPVNLNKCLDTVLSDKNVRIIVEIGPSGVVKHLLAEKHSEVRVISTVLGRRKGKDSRKHSQLFQSVADLWTHGFKIDFLKLFPCSDFDPHLPTYQFENTICWREKIGTEGLKYYTASWKTAARIDGDRAHFHKQDVLLLSEDHNEFLDFDCKLCQVQVRKPSEVLKDSLEDIARFSLILYVLHEDLSDITEPFLVSHTICAAIVAQTTRFMVVSLTGEALHWTTLGPIREYHLGRGRKNSFVDNSEGVPLPAVVQSVLRTKEEVVLATKKFLLSMVYAEAHPPSSSISLGETVVVIGGTGAIGSTYVEVLRKTAGVKNIIVLSRTPSTTTNVPGVSFFTMDVSEKNSVERVMDELYSRYGRIHTLIHSAGRATSKSLHKSVSDVLPVLLPKVGGITNILQYLCRRGLKLDNLLMASSTSSVVALQGTEDYAAANIFMDALALNGHSNVSRILSVQWPAWKSIGMASTYGQGELQSMIMRTAISPEAGKRIVRETLTFGGVIAPSSISPLEMRELVEKAQLVGETPRLRVETDGKLSLRDKVASVWCEVLGTEVSDDSDFFGCGGNSLSALRAVWGINMSLKTNITVDLLFKYPLFKDFIKELPCERSSDSDERFDRTSLAELTYSQENMFLLRQLERGTQYNILFTIRFRRKTHQFSEEKLVYSLHSLIARQHTLRTCFSQQAGFNTAHQTVLSLTESFQNLACRDINPRESDQVIEEEQNFEFTLEEVPLRLRVNRVNGEYIVLFNQHHILTDGWSLTVLADELKNIYSLYSSSKRQRPVPLPYSVSQYAHWQRRHVQFSEELEELKPLLSAREGTMLPQKLVVGTSNKFIKLIQILPESLTSCIKALAKMYHTTDFVVVLSAFVLSLRKLKASSQDDSIVIGCPVLGRNEKVKDLIGYFLNNTVISLDVQPKQSLEDVVLMVKKTTSEMRRFECIPFHKLVAGLNDERRLNAHPIFQIFFNYRHELDFPTVTFPDAQVEIDQLSINKIFDLSITFDETPKGSRAMVEYNSSKYRSETVRNLLRGLLGSLTSRSSSSSKGRHVRADFPMRVLQSDTVLPVGIKCGLALRRKDSLLLGFEEMHARISNIAESVNDSWTKLLGCSIRSDDIIAVELSPGDAIEAILAVHQTGAAYAPIDPLWPKSRKTQIMDNIGISFAITKDTSLCASQKLRTRRMKFNRAVGSDIAYVIHTSGSTGSPKGVVLSHRNLSSFFRAATPQILMRPGHRVSHSVNTVFDVSVMNIFGSFVNNCELCLHDDIRRSPFEIAGMECNFVFLTSAAFNALTAEDIRKMSTLEKLLVGGETVNDRNLAEALEFGLDVTQIYGPTEGTIWSLTNRCKKLQNEGALIGMPMLNEICSTKFNMYEGELVLRGPKVARGYINVGKNRQFYLEDSVPCYFTGDIVRVEKEGYFFRGRIDRQVKLRGHRIEIDEVERAILTSSPEVSEATVVPSEKSILAFIVCTEPVEGRRIFTRLSTVLPSYMIPSSFIRVPNTPVNSSGKVDQNALLKEYNRIRNLHSEELSSKARTTSSIEDTLISIIQKLLLMTDVTVDDNFFSVGGNSLLLFDLQKEIHNSFAVNIEVHELFAYKTIAELAKLISSKTKETISDTDTSMIIKLRETNGGKLNVYLIHAIGGSIFPYHAFPHVLPKQINVYAIEYKLDFEATSLKELAAFYAKAVIVHTKNLPLFLMGHSMGGTISREMVEEMKQWDREPHRSSSQSLREMLF